jgi:hypothetical protein
VLFRSRHKSGGFFYAKAIEEGNCMNNSHSGMIKGRFRGVCPCLLDRRLFF